MSKFTKIIVSICTVFAVVSISLIGWLVYILNFAPQKIASTTYIIGNQQIEKVDPETGELITESKPFWEISIYNNAFELKFNEIFDENQNAFYSTGLQYISNIENKAPDFSVEKWLSSSQVDYSNYSEISSVDISYRNYSEKNGEKYLLFKDGKNYYEYYGHILKANDFQNMSYFEYQSANDTGFINNQFANPINEDTLFKLQIDNKIYGMKLKYDDIPIGEETFLFTRQWCTNVFGSMDQHFTYARHQYFRAYDIHFLSELLYNSFKGLPAGTSQQYTIRLADYFDFYEFNGKTYEEDKILNVGQALISYVNSNFGIKVNVYDYDLNSSSKSMFDNYKGYKNVNESDISNEVLDYKTSKNVFTLTIDNFDFISTGKVGEYILRLSNNEFINNIDKSITVFELNIDITGLGITIYGIEKTSVKGLEIYHATLIENGVESGVLYV